MDEYKLKDYTERLKKETNENAHKMLYMWIKQDIISLSEYQQLVLNLSLQLVSKSFTSEQIESAYDVGFENGCEHARPAY